MSLRTNLVVIACAGALLACGEDAAPEPVATTATTPAATATATPPAATATATPTATPTATAAPQDEGGDEDGNRVELRFDLHAEDVRPARIDVPAFLGLRIRIRNRSGSERIVRLGGRPVLELLPGEAQTAELEGLRPGEHLLEAGESGRATLRAVRAE